MARTLRETLVGMREALGRGERPQATVEELPCFGGLAVRGNPAIAAGSLQAVLDSLGAEDIATLDAALEMLDGGRPGGEAGGQPAWLGFKVVGNAALAVDSQDTQVVGIQGKGAGSADGTCGIFVATEDKQLIFSRQYSARDEMQMLDITRGPHMHAEQYAGLTWLSLPLSLSGRVYVFGAGEVAHYLERMAQDCGFDTVVIDDDPAFLNAERLPLSERVLVESFESLPDLGVGAQDYVLVLTRGHMYDPEVLVYGIKAGAQYVGMMGMAAKNERVFAMAMEQGITREQLEATHTPIGLKFGAKTPAELALCIVAELVQVRAARRKG